VTLFWVPAPVSETHPLWHASRLLQESRYNEEVSPARVGDPFARSRKQGNLKEGSAHVK
jgi:hypothetical protein